MNAKELFKIICPEGYEDVTIESIVMNNPKYPMEFSVLDHTEYQLYENNQDKVSFVGNSESIRVLDLELQEYYNFVKQRTPIIEGLIMEELQEYHNQVPPEYLCISHMLLHELEHYKQYIDLGKKVYQYSHWCAEETYENEVQQERQVKMMDHYASVGDRYDEKKQQNSLENYDLMMIAAKWKEAYDKYINLQVAYRNIPKEKEADDFAYANMPQAVEKLLQFFDKT